MCNGWADNESMRKDIQKIKSIRVSKQALSFELGLGPCSKIYL
jgi:hypothetical protein